MSWSRLQHSNFGAVSLKLATLWSLVKCSTNWAIGLCRDSGLIRKYFTHLLMKKISVIHLQCNSRRSNKVSPTDFISTLYLLNFWFHSNLQMSTLMRWNEEWKFRHSELIVKYSIGLKTLLQQGISEPISYGDLGYKFKRIVGKPNFSDQFKKIVKRYIRVGYNLDIMGKSTWLVLNPITVYSCSFLFNCMTVGQASDSMTALT